MDSSDSDDSNDYNLPDEFSWVEAGGVTAVKDQQHCGSCWAFSAIGALEGAYFAKCGKLLRFSEQQLIDCDTQEQRDDLGRVDHNKGCHGGDMYRALNYFQDNFAMLESDYPFTSATGDDSTECLYSLPKSS